MVKALKGFTLIETLLVIAILGILSIALVTRIFNYKRSYIEVTSKKAASDIEYARSLAMMKQGTTYGVFFDDANDRYTVYATSTATPVADPQTKQNLIETFSRWPGVTITGGNFTVEFNQWGSPTTGGGGSVTLTDGTNSKTVTITAGTGKVSVQ
ncbi:MAG: type II secretion system protein [Deltaproteobacteria bacterium]|nr:type II secretion system protein [Deltaproteobacteria bacterium]MBI2342511.1 type II secretion system protein [Deltaproteobacteria bacterium]